MTLLEYLVPSRARRELLKALRFHGHGLTVRRLSRQTGVAYSSAHREVEQMRRLGLARVEREGRALVCTWNGGHPAARALEGLLRPSPGNRKGGPDDEALFWNLRRWGAPLARTGTVGAELPLESTLAYGLELARRHPDVARVWPVVLARHRSRMDLPALMHLAGRLGQKRTLGFFLSLTRRLLKDPSLGGPERRLRDGRFRTTQDFFQFLPPQGGRARELAERRTPAIARKWRFRMNMTLESFVSTFERFAGRP